MNDRCELHIPLSYDAYDESSIVPTSVWGFDCEGIYCGDEISDWFSKALNIPNLMLLRFSRDCVRKTDQRYAPNGQVFFIMYRCIYHMYSMFSIACSDVYSMLVYRMPFLMATLSSSCPSCRLKR